MLTSDLFENKTPAAMKSDMAEGLNEFAPPGSDGGNDGDGFDEATLKRLAAQWWNGDEDPRVEQLLMNTGWEIGQDEGYDNGGVFVVMSGDENGDTYLSWPAEELQGVTEGLPQTLRKFVPGYAKREIDKKMDAQKFGKDDVAKDANYYRYKKIQDKLKEQGVAEGAFDNYSPMAQQQIAKDKNQALKNTSADEVIRDLIQGSLDGYDVMAHPRTPAQKVVAKMMQEKYDDIAINHRLHPDDDFEEIISRVIDDFEEDYGTGLTEEQDLAEAVSTLELADFLYRGLEQKFPKVVERYGHEVVGDAIMDVAEENQDVNSVSDVDMLIDDIIEKLQNYSGNNSGLAESEVSRLYYNVVGTSGPELRKDFGMRRDRRGWFLSESSGRSRIMDAHRAFGSPKLVEYDLTGDGGGAATLGPDNVVSPIGTVPRGQQLNKKAKSKKV